MTLNASSDNGISLACIFREHSAIFELILLFAFSNSSVVFTSANISKRSKNNDLIKAGVWDFFPVNPFTSTLPFFVTPR